MKKGFWFEFIGTFIIVAIIATTRDWSFWQTWIATASCMVMNGVWRKDDGK